MKKFNFKKIDKTFIVAEIGVNHEGSFLKSKKMITMAAECGVDAVKFQTFKAEKYVSSNQKERFERVKRFELSSENFFQISKFATSYNLTFFSTPLHSDDLKSLVKISPIIKISSGDLTNIDLIESVALTKKSIILSTGLGTQEEIRNAVKAVEKIRPSVRKEGGLAIMHCVAAYPTPEDEVNLKNLLWIKETFDYPIGYSDHTLGTKACELAVAFGAKIIEKHFTYRKENQSFHDHKISADKRDMLELVNKIRRVERMSGNYERKVGKSESKMKKHLRRSIYALKQIPLGKVISKDDLVLLRPALGLAPSEMKNILGKKTKKKISAGQIIKKSHV